MLRSIKSHQRMRRDLHIRVTGTGTAALAQVMDYQQVSLTDDGTGLYTITLDQPFAEAPIVQLTSLTAGLFGEVVSSSTSAIQVRFKDSATQTATDAVFFMSIMGSDTADRH
jgi:hypothetical protein